MRALRKFVASVNAECRQSGRQRQDAVLDLPILGNQHDQRALRLEPHELDVLEPRVRLHRQHHAGRARQSRQHARGFGQHGVDRLGGAGGGDLRLDRLAVVLGHVTDLHQCIDEEAQAAFGRQAAGRGVRRIDEAELFEVRHHVAHRGRRQRHRDDAREIARADRLAGRKVALDDLAENFARALIELREPGLSGGSLGRSERSLVGHRSLLVLPVDVYEGAPSSRRDNDIRNRSLNVDSPRSNWLTTPVLSTGICRIAREIDR